MKGRWIAEDQRGTIPLAGYLVGYLAFISAIFLGLYGLLQPMAIANLGLAAYRPPPQTRLEPLPRKMDAPELTALEPPSSLRTFAQEYVATSAVEAPPDQQVSRPARKRTRTDFRHEYREPSWAFAPGWNAQPRYRQSYRFW